MPKLARLDLDFDRDAREFLEGKMPEEEWIYRVHKGVGMQDCGPFAYLPAPSYEDRRWNLVHNDIVDHIKEVCTGQRRPFWNVLTKGWRKQRLLALKLKGLI